MTPRPFDRVECIDASESHDPGEGVWHAKPLAHGAIYTVIGTGYSKVRPTDYDPKPQACIELAEVSNPIKSIPGFRATRFRVLIETELPAEITNLLETTKADEVVG